MRKNEIVRSLSTGATMMNCGLIKDAIKKYYKRTYECCGKKNIDYRISRLPESSIEFWNCRINGMSVAKDNVWVDIYWQGDSTDGDDWVSLKDLYTGTSGKDYLIPSTYQHDRLRITRDMLNEAFVRFAQALADKKSVSKPKATN